MSARSKEEDSLLAALSAAWDAGNPVAGQNEAVRLRISRIALRRISSFTRRGIDGLSQEAKLTDLAQGLAAELEAQPAGPLIRDYEHLAQVLLGAHATAVGHASGA